MTDEVQKQDARIHYLYRIINKINNKVYIGQTIEPNKRWYQHRRDAAEPTMAIHYAINKYDAENFEFEIIACCKTWEDANETETELVKQYESHISTGKGYNVSYGGYNAPKSEAWKQAIRDWHASLSPEEKEARSKMHSEATIKQIEENGHPALGTKRTDEQKLNISNALKALDKEAIYTPEVRKNMSEAHIGHKDTEETKQNKSKAQKARREQEITNSDNMPKCSVEGCDISGFKQVYIILDEVRYCSTHGQRMRRHGTVEKLPPFKYTKDNPMPEDIRKKCGAANIGRIAHNRKVFTEEQTLAILKDNRSNKKIAKDFSITEKVIKKIKLERKSKNL